MALIPKTEYRHISEIAVALARVSSDPPHIIADALCEAIKPARAMWTRAVAACNWQRDEARDARADLRDSQKVSDAIGRIKADTGKIGLEFGGDARAPQVRISADLPDGTQLLRSWSAGVGLY